MVSFPVQAVIHLENLRGIGEPVIIRDPSGRSARPSLEVLGGPGGANGRLEVQGLFLAIQRYSVEPWEGLSFVRVTRDENPIHRGGDIVPGAMTASRPFLLPELLLGSGRVVKAKMRFRAIAYYRRPTVNLYRFQLSGPGSLKVELSVRQDGVEIADGCLQVLLGEPRRLPEIGASGSQVDGEAEKIRTFLRSLRVDPSLYFRGAGNVYPRAYLAALPPGEMVRKYSGEGGILNSIEFDFPGEAVLGESREPMVELQDSARARKTFRKIIARIAEGVRTFCSGFAMVLPRETAVGIMK